MICQNGNVKCIASHRIESHCIPLYCIALYCIGINTSAESVKVNKMSILSIFRFFFMLLRCGFEGDIILISSMHKKVQFGYLPLYW